MFAGSRLGAGDVGLGSLDSIVRAGNTGLGGSVTGSSFGCVGSEPGRDSGETNSDWPSAAETVANPKTNTSSQAWLFLRRRLAATFVWLGFTVVLRFAIAFGLV